MLKYHDEYSRYSEKELEDIYYHIDVLKNPDQYRALLAELEARRLKPQIADRPLPDLCWDLKAWLIAIRLLNTHPKMLFAVASTLAVTISLSLTYLYLLPFWILVVMCRVNNNASALIYMLCLPLPAFAAWRMTPPFGTHGKMRIAILLGIGLAIVLFAHTGTFQAIIAPLIESEKSGGSSPMGFGGM